MVDTALRNHIVSVFDNHYLPTLKNLYTGYVMKMMLGLIHNLYSYYARISATDMPYNGERLRSL